MTNKREIDNLRKILVDALIPLIKTDYVLLDVPNHCNIGDNLIWEGELLFLKNHIDKKNIYSANARNFESNLVPDNSTILLHGGGNFGDLYPFHNNFRINIIKKFPNNPIIIFPQTVYYKNMSLLEEHMAIIKKHKNIVICARDIDSYNLLRNYLSEESLRLLPDMAFFIDIESNNENRKDKKALIMKRTDKELDQNNYQYRDIYKNLSDQNYIVEIKDWPTFKNNIYLEKLYTRLRGQKNKLSTIFQKNKLLKGYVSPTFGLNNRKNRDKYVKQGVDFFNQYDIIYTTRLHGLILAILMGKQVVILDNNYGKVTTFYKSWLKNFENISIE